MNRICVVLFFLSGSAVCLGCGDSNGGTNGDDMTIGPEGGSFTTQDGVVGFSVPPDALSQNVAFTVSQGTSETTNGTVPTCDIGPNGTIFSKPATITFKVDSTTFDNETDGGFRIVVTGDDSKTTWEVLEDINIDRQSNSISSKVSHLSEMRPIFYCWSSKPCPECQVCYGGIDISECPSGEDMCGECIEVLNCETD